MNTESPSNRADSVNMVKRIYTLTNASLAVRQLAATGYERFFLPAVFLIALLLSCWTSQYFPMATSYATAALVGIWFIYAAALLHRKSSLQQITLVPHFKVSASWFLVAVCVAAPWLASAYMLMLNFSALGIVCLLFALKIQCAQRRIVTVCVVLLVTEVAALWLYSGHGMHSAMGTYGELSSMIEAVFVQLRWASVIAVVFLAMALASISPILGLLTFALVATLWSKFFGMVNFLPASLNRASIGLAGSDVATFALALALLGLLLMVTLNKKLLLNKRKITSLVAFWQPTKSGSKTPTPGFVSSWLPAYGFLLSRASTATFNFNRLLPYAFPRELHWSVPYLVGLVVTALVAIVAWFAGIKKPYELVDLSSTFAMVFFAQSQFYVSRYRLGLNHSQREHAMLRLTPKWPTHANVNAAYARHVLLYFFSISAVSAILQVGVAFSVGFEPLLRSKTSAVLIVSFLLAIIFALPQRGDSTRSRARHLNSMWVYAAGLLAFMLIGLYFRNFAYLQFVCAVCMICAVYRYWHFVRGPKALPAMGRMR